ncbi:hypothetical protein [Catenisphaera adipataccumulans]|jgi:hypothetical protein|uniref:Uncharacterized protein n=1 Tax=Catenisphaera adipataccumulans TaxID=700500 RepID=A0A7W8CVU8_9FIRM|nr:hypothetical protein [Catenisphaera adipataccumulans]MBB5182556.1 hypothetical protein [Catenisphaera adipataccumulans]
MNRFPMESVVTDNTNIMNATSQPDVFFACRKLYFETMTMLTNSHYLPESELSGAFARDIDTVNRFIDRFWDETRKKAGTCTDCTDVDRVYHHFFDKMDAYQYTMDDTCRRYYNDKESTGPLILQKMR